MGNRLRYSFSLMEVMVVLLLVALIAGVSVFSLIPFYQTYRFRLEVDTLYELVQELQLEALTLQSDIKICFTKKNGKWLAETASGEVVLKPQTLDLSHIDQIQIDPPQDFTLIFHPNGLIQPSAILSCKHRQEKRGLDFAHPPLIKLWIGSPSPFTSLSIPEIKEKNEANKPGI